MVEGIAELGWLEMVGRLGLAALLGGILGIEREYDGQDAGFRTHLLVVLGAALFAVVSVGGFDEFVDRRSETNVAVDITRIAAYVAPGIGFIGGGAIVKYGGKVSGITTAASLWTAAAIGVATGLGALASAVAATGLALFALEALRPISRAVERIGSRRRSGLVVELAEGANLAEVLAVIGEPLGGAIKQLQFGVGPDVGGRIAVEFWHQPDDRAVTAMTDQLLSMDGVERVTIDTSRAEGKARYP
jgi:putative Mg2+ transporter-C (MgtC) family protein